MCKENLTGVYHEPNNLVLWCTCQFELSSFIYWWTPPNSSPSLLRASGNPKRGCRMLNGWESHTVTMMPIKFYSLIHQLLNDLCGLTFPVIDTVYGN